MLVEPTNVPLLNALTVIVCLPFPAGRVSQVVVYGAAPVALHGDKLELHAPSTYGLIEVAADPAPTVMLTIPDTVAPFAGLTIQTTPVEVAVEVAVTVGVAVAVALGVALRFLMCNGPAPDRTCP
jgi:hypothetical protein